MTSPATDAELSAITGQPRARRWPSGLLALTGSIMLAVGAWLAPSYNRGALRYLDGAEGVFGDMEREAREGMARAGS